MGTKQVRLSEAVYAKIKDKKRPDETFSEAIDRLTTDWSLAEFGTGMTDEERATYRTALDEIEQEGEANITETVDELGTDE